MNLDEIPEATLLARGRYSTVRGAHEDALKQLQALTGQLAASGSQLLRHMQPPGDDTPEMGGALDMVMLARETVDKIDACIEQIHDLAAQKKLLKPMAWPR